MQLVARSLHAAGYRIHVVCPREEGEPRRRVHDGVEVWTFRMPSERLRLGGLGAEYAYSAVVMTAL